jgi:hypothetical protein
MKLPQEFPVAVFAHNKEKLNAVFRHFPYMKYPDNPAIMIENRR